jgi:hypothetical protein
MTVVLHVGQRIPYLYVPPWIGQGGSPFIQVAQMRQVGSAGGMSARDPLLVLPVIQLGDQVRERLGQRDVLLAAALEGHRRDCVPIEAMPFVKCRQ